MVKKQGDEIFLLNSKVEESTKRVEEIDSEVRKITGENEDFTTKLNKYKDQLYLVTSNKEYDALNQEIDHMKQAVESSEDKLLELEEEKSTLDAILEVSNGQIKSITDLKDKNQKELDVALEETKVEQSKLEKTREKIIKTIDSIYLRKYETTRKAWDGHGLVSINRNACGSCFSTLPPQTVIEVKKNDNLHSCPSCGILLFWDGAED